MHDVYNDSVFNPPEMASSSSKIPNASRYSQYVIAGNISTAVFDAEGAPEATIPSGGIFSTTNDLSRFGTAILNSTLLDSDQTCLWMKQVSHTAMFEYSMGRPWEIYRYKNPRTELITHIYTKLGDCGNCGGYIIMIPDLDAGFSIICASSLTETSTQTALLVDLILDSMVSALKAQAEMESRQNFVSTYTSRDQNLNCTLTLAVNPTGAPGLVITRFISNGTDVLRSGAIGRSPVRLLRSITDRANGQIAFRTSSLRSPAVGLFMRQYTSNLD